MKIRNSTAAAAEVPPPRTYTEPNSRNGRMAALSVGVSAQHARNGGRILFDHVLPRPYRILAVYLLAGPGPHRTAGNPQKQQIGGERDSRGSEKPE